MLIGYVDYEIATKSQEQATLAQLYDVGCRQVFTDERDAPNNAKLGFKQALGSLNPNDILVVTQINHLGKSADSLIKNLGLLLEKEANLQILGDNLLLPLKDSIHVSLIKILVNFQQQKIESQTQARKTTLAKHGKKVGRRPLDEQTAQLVNTLLKDGYKPKDICRYAQISESTYYKYRKSLLEGDRRANC